MTKDILISEATKAREKAYAPYSEFQVGAALQTKSGKIYTGCNIENVAFPVTCCAERVAIFTAIANGEKEFTEMAIIASTARPIPPCGSCRQVMSEFFDNTMEIHLANLSGMTHTMTIEALLPLSFQPKDLKDK